MITMRYDSQGRRYFKKVTVAGTVTLHRRYIYRGYLQIACVDCTRSGHPALWFVTWDPSQPTATRPLAIQKDGTWFTYGYDITKNICEVFGPAGYIRTAYSYAPFGNVTESGDVSQPFQWSSEHYDSELDLVYYNYRHYSPALGRFLSRDPIAEQGGWNLYVFVGNNATSMLDMLGNVCCVIIVYSGGNSSTGHAILDCGNEGYLSFFPKRKTERKKGVGKWSGKNHSREEDLKEYGNWPERLKDGVNDDLVPGKDGKKNRITRQCLPTCIDSSKAKAVITSLLASTPNWDFDDSNCADMVIKALSSLIKSDKPKCKKYECPRDLLRNRAWLTTPTGVERIVRKIQENNCNRYECVRRNEPQLTHR